MDDFRNIVRRRQVYPHTRSIPKNSIPIRVTEAGKKHTFIQWGARKLKITKLQKGFKDGEQNRNASLISNQ